MLNIEKIKQNKTVSELLEFGIINIDKPSGPTSFQVDESVKSFLGLRKTSHFGTLDPKVTGVLPIALNRACKLMKWFMEKEKTYVGIMKLHSEIEEEKLKDEIKKFIGKIKQKPPVRSRVKREEREREVYEFKILEKNEKNIVFEAKVEAGTYIRKLIHDLGENIGGAHMSELRRTKAGIFTEKDKNFVNLYELQKAVEEYKRGNEKLLKEIIIPGEIIGLLFPVVEIDKRDINAVLHGSMIYYGYLPKKPKIDAGKIICIFSENKFIGIYKTTKEEKVFARPEFVLQPLR